MPMWKFLYQLSSPKIFYDWTRKCSPWFAASAILTVLIGLIWGLFIAPADYQQGDAFRIIYIHVPSAFLSMSIYAFMGFLSILLLVWRIKLAGVMLKAAASMGAVMAILALVTGSIWGKPMWGAWWVWDARLTSELILLFLYGAIIVTTQAFDNQEQGDKVAAILTLVGLVDLPIIHYSVYWWNTLHQGATISSFQKPKIHTSMLYPLLVMIVGFLIYCAWMMLYHARVELLKREKRKGWVKSLVDGGKL